MLLTNSFDVAQPLDKVWAFFDDIPAVAACLPGAELTQDLGEDKYLGKVGIRMGPVRMAFDGQAAVVERDAAAHRLVLDAAGSDQKGRGNAAMVIRAQLTPTARGTTVSLEQDLQLSGAAAQFGRGMVSDVNAVIMGQFAQNMQQRMEAADRGEVLSAKAGQASAFSIAVQAARMALSRVLRRFFLPFEPVPR